MEPVRKVQEILCVEQGMGQTSVLLKAGPGPKAICFLFSLYAWYFFCKGKNKFAIFA
jgi:hypothetical protein